MCGGRAAGRPGGYISVCAPSPVSISQSVSMALMSSSGKFVPQEYEVDYDQEPCYAHYGLRNGDINRYTKMLENETFRTAIQVRYDSIDFVRKFTDELKLRFSGPAYLSLVNQWAEIQEHSVKNDGKFMPYYVSEDKRFSVESRTFGNKNYNMLYINPKRKMSLALSDAEIMCNSQADMRAIYDRWVKVNQTDLSQLVPIKIELGRGNSKVVESPCSAVHNPQQYDESLKNYLPDNVVQQNMGYESSEQQQQQQQEQDQLQSSLPDLFVDDFDYDPPSRQPPPTTNRKRTLVTPAQQWTHKTKRQY